ncbi:methyltransferase domain-containing protein [Microbacterium sp. NPDC089189]|uniref:methyltransferase domain-containing protein n=1 Tax=Microbacterium sp. NPDC089189 TaxID=3154972 RepID=UPI00343D0DFB
MSLAIRATDLRELMDDPDCDPRRLAATLRRFDVVNRAVSGWGGVYRRTLRPWLRALDRPARVLDLGCGGGDVLARLARAAGADGIRAEWIGVDPDPRALTVAQERRSPGLSFRTTDSAVLRAAGETFDVVLSNHVLHHLGDEELTRFADDSRALSTGIVLHGDIERGALAYGLYGVGILPLAPGTFLRTDGLRSIRRSFRAAELRDALPGDWQVVRPAPFRLLAIGRGRA